MSSAAAVVRRSVSAPQRTIRTMLSAGENDRKTLLQHYAACFRKCSVAVAELAAKRSSGVKTRNEAWRLFYEYVKVALALAISNGKRDVFELENAQPLVIIFLSVLFSSQNCIDEINSRLNYIAKRAFDSAWSKNEDAYSPLDALDSFRQMLGGHLEQTAEVNRIFGRNGRGDASIVSLQAQLLDMEFEQARFKQDQKEFAYFERLHHSALNLLKKIGRNAAYGGQPGFKAASSWEIRAALKDHVQLAEGKSSVRCTDLTWENVCSIKAAIRKTSPEEDRQQPRSKHNLR